MPGSRLCPGFGITARRLIVPVFGSTRESVKSSWPSLSYSVPSGRKTRAREPPSASRISPVDIARLKSSASRSAIVKFTYTGSSRSIVVR